MLLQAFDGECAAPSGGAADVVDIAIAGKKIPSYVKNHNLLKIRGK